MSCEEDGQKTELGVERESGQSSHVVLCQACEVLESTEDSLYRDAFPVGSPEFLRSVALEFPIDSENPFDAFLLVSRIRYDRNGSLFKRRFPEARMPVPKFV